ncbi:GNAT family N-acetyltransferase [Streptococcus oricebi]|uniref:GNAT family N-acetyltransferase n=1 Tax=Streptococcus oricebi TaxID=1547447 RepID=A0ABS5B5G9_9STRE|nr:GNAT family N-acetyltransferase [Streptococcus oricebi]MBP2623946.1 GNAT family N-acetyltransferase [Streptococcus oricebi]
MELRRPSLADKAAIIDMIDEFIAARSYMHGGLGSTWQLVETYEDWLELIAQHEQGENLPEDWLPAAQFVTFDDQGRALGFLSIRLALNERTFVEGGHVGYSIRPSERGQGLGKEQLRLGLLEAKKLGLEHLLITCDEDNLASKQVILANGGQYDNKIEGVERYWLDLEEL